MLTISCLFEVGLGALTERGKLSADHWCIHFVKLPIIKEEGTLIPVFLILQCVPRLQGCCFDVTLARDELGAVIEPSLDIFMDVVINILVGVFALFLFVWRNTLTGRRSYFGDCRAG